MEVARSVLKVVLVEARCSVRGNWALQKNEAPGFRVQGDRLESPCCLD